jgi:hypothetical protein
LFRIGLANLDTNTAATPDNVETHSRWMLFVRCFGSRRPTILAIEKLSLEDRKMSFKRILVFAPVFLLTYSAGFGFFAGTTAVAAYLRTAKEPVLITQAAVQPVLPSSPVQVAVADPPISQRADAETADTAAHETAEREPEQIEWHGVYGFDSESLPKTFGDLSHVEIALYDFEKTDEDGNSGLPIPPKGFLQAGKEFRFKRIALAGKQIAFQTETLNGVSYRFTGKYLALDYCETDGSTPDVSGELIKIVNGKWAAAIKAVMYQECGC